MKMKITRLMRGINEMKKGILPVLVAYLIGMSNVVSAEPIEQVWSKSYSTGFNLLMDIAIDSENNIIVTGWDLFTGIDTIKYDSNGEVIWLDSEPSISIANAITVDSSDNIIVGATESVDLHTIKYLPNGITDWIKIYDSDSEDSARSVARDGNDNIVIFGEKSSSGIPFEWEVIKYDKDGYQLWYSTFTGPYGGNVYAQAVAIDSNDNIVLAGYGQYDSASIDFIIVKYTPDGDMFWDEPIVYHSESGNRYARAVCIDKDDNIIVAGERNSRLYVQKYDPEGNFVWDAEESSTTSAAYAMTIDKNGRILAGGMIQGTAEEKKKNYIVSYDTSGSKLWDFAYNPTAINDCIYGLAVDSNNDIGVGSCAGSEYLTEKYKYPNTPPEIISATISPDPAYTNDDLTATGVATDADGDSITLSYQWKKNGVDIAGETNQNLDSSKFIKGDSISVVITPNDGQENGEPLESDALVISNSTPVLASMGDKSISEKEVLEFTISATDADGDSLTYSASNLPGGATFNPGTQIFNWTPSFEQAGTYEGVHFEVSDGADTDFEEITITVVDVTVIVSIEDLEVQEGSTITAPIIIDDKEGNMNLGAGVITVTYDSSIVNVTNVISGALPSLSWNANNDEGWVKIVALGSGPVNGKIIFADITYEAVGSSGESSLLTITIEELINWDYYYIPYIIDNGTFTIESAPADTTPPYISEYSPAKDAKDVPRGTNIVIHIKDDGAGVDKASIVMTVEGISVSPTITGNKNDYTLTYDPPSDFEYDQVVDVTIDAQDLASPPNVIVVPQGSYLFAVESVPVTITAHLPTGTNVLVDTMITVTFSKAMNQNLAQSAFSISPAVSGLFDWDGNKMIFYPDSKLDYETTYTITIGTTAEDLVGNNLESEYFWQFTTISKAPEEKVVVFPNPYVAGKFTQDGIVFTELPKESTLRIYTISGKLVKEIRHQDTTDGGSEEWDISEIASGVYIYTIISADGKKTGKVCIVK